MRACECIFALCGFARREDNIGGAAHGICIDDDERRGKGNSQRRIIVLINSSRELLLRHLANLYNHDAEGAEQEQAWAAYL